MANDVSVREIVETYELPPRLADKIALIAKIRLAELGLTRFDDVYRYIDYLVRRHTTESPYDRTVSLDSPISPHSDSGYTLHDVIGTEDRAQTEEHVGYKYREDQERLHAHEVLEILREHVSGQSSDILKHLLDHNNGGYVNFSPEEIAANIEYIQTRLNEMTNRFEINGNLVIPRRPIVSVHFDPLEIRFGRRRYNDEPLAYFLAHPEVYDSLSRTELQRVDSGLYDALWKKSQIGIAIPETRLKRLTEPMRDEAVRVLIKK